MIHTTQTSLFGAHISSAGGLEQAIQRGEALGCTAIQIFTKSNRQWFAKPLTEETIRIFQQTFSHSTIKVIVAHAAYLINVGASHHEIRKASTKALAHELERCQLLGIPYLVLHPGTHTTTTEEQCLYQTAQEIDNVFEQVPGNTLILLETMAGQGGNICYRFEQIAALYQASMYKNRLGVCFDTCHVFAAGYDLRTESVYEKTWKEFDDIIGRNLLKVIHLNDSKKELGSRIDRHEHIGKGFLGITPFQLIFQDKRLSMIPKILETPRKTASDDMHNMQTIKQLLKK